MPVFVLHRAPFSRSRPHAALRQVDAGTSTIAQPRGTIGVRLRFVVMRRFLLPLLMLAGCVATPSHRREAAPGPSFSPMAFFAGDTIGEGSLKIVLHRSRPVRVVGHGAVEPDGTLRLVQQVHEGDALERMRTWRIRAIGGDRYAGTLSDASGPVAMETRGNRLHIAYRAKGGLDIEQWLFSTLR